MTKRRSRPVKMDDKIKDYVPPQFETQQQPDLFGLEIELEGKNIVTDNMTIHTYWQQHKDGSLRIKAPGDQAIEYVSRGPQTLKQLTEGLTALTTYLNKPGVVVYDSYRTSIHVHVNCMEETVRTVVNFMTLSMIFDELFVSQNGQTRIGNNFCLRTRDAEGQITDVINSLTMYGNPYGAISQNNRYSSVNMASLAKFGTIEFRSLECTTDYDRIIHWVNTCQALKVAARGFENPREIIAEFSRKGPLGFMMMILGKQALKYVAVPGYHDMLHTGMRLAQDLAYSSEWIAPTQQELKYEKPFIKKNLKMKVNNPVQFYQDLAALQGNAPQGGVLWGNNPAAEVQIAPAADPNGWNFDDLDQL